MGSLESLGIYYNVHVHVYTCTLYMYIHVHCTCMYMCRNVLVMEWVLVKVLLVSGWYWTGTYSGVLHTSVS